MTNVPAEEVGIVDYDKKVRQLFDKRKSYGRIIYILRYLLTLLLVSSIGYYWLNTWWSVIVFMVIGHFVYAISELIYTAFKARGYEKQLAIFSYLLDNNSLDSASLEELGSRIVFLQLASLDSAKLPDLKYHDQFMSLLNAYLRLYAETRGDTVAKQYSHAVSC